MSKRQGSESTVSTGRRAKRISKGLVKFHLKRPRLTIHEAAKAEKAREEKNAE